MCVPTLLAMVVIGCFSLYLVFLLVSGAAHFFFEAPLATNIFNYLLRRKSGVLDVCGRQVTFLHKAKGRNGPSSLELRFAGNFNARAVFRTEAGADRLGKDFGLNRELQFNDPEFDQAVYVECDDETFVRCLLETAEAKQKLKELLERFAAFEVKDGSCVLTMTPCDDFDAVSLHYMLAASADMLVLADRLAPAGPAQGSLTPITESSLNAELVYTAGGISLALSGAVIAFWGAQAFEPVLPWRAFLASLYPALTLLLVLAVFLYLRFKGTAAGLRAFSRSLAFGGAGIVLWCWGWLLVLNGSQDGSAALAYEVKVVDKHISSGRGGGFTLRLSSWDKALEVYNLGVRRKEFELVEVGDTCVVSVKKGLFGLAWIDGKLCQGRGRLLGSGNAGGAVTQDNWRFYGGFFREIPAPLQN